MKQSRMILLGAVAVLGWLAFVDRPTAKNLRTAIVGTLPLV